MALSIKTKDADRLARQLARLTGETMTTAITVALKERLDRVRATHRERADMPEKIEAIFARYRKNYDTRPVTQAEWDWAGGDEFDR
jgi:antitoxin VapB